jgi:virginiamycin B lyase
VVEYDVPAGSHPHDVAVAPDGGVWYTAQNAARMGRLDPATGEVIEVPLGGNGSAPHGVIIGPDGHVWVTDQGANAIVRIEYAGGPVTPETTNVTTYEMPDGRVVGPHTPTLDADGILWFTGSNGFIGRLDPAVGEVELFDSPRGPGPYGIDATPAGDVWYVNLSASYLASIDSETGESTVFEPLTPNQGARRVWSDSTGRLWISEWNSGQLSRYDPASGEWRAWPLPGDSPMAYAVYVDEVDDVWVTDFGSNAIVRFDPLTETFEPFVLPSANAEVRELLGRPGEVWGAESGTDKLVVIRRL